ncbi:MAG: hypothetical protein WC378_00580 [Opitutaceae bacterium]|jgi:hypothetical protein
MKRISFADTLWRLLLGAGLVAGCIFIYHRLPEFDFVAFDDDINITLNSHLGPPSMESVRWMFSDFTTILRYMPLGWLSYSLIFTAGGLDPMWYHSVVLALHILNALLACLLAQRVISLAGADGPEGRDRRWAVFAAVLGAAFWAWHPLRVETTSWCTGLLYVLSCFWMLLSALAYCAALERYISNGRWGALLPVSVGLFAISLLSYGSKGQERLAEACRREAERVANSSGCLKLCE